MDTSKIPGFPLGVRISRVGKAQSGDYYWDGAIHRWSSVGHESYSNYFVFAPDNPYGVVDLTEVPIPEGYERDGSTPAEWYRIPKPNEFWISSDPTRDVTPCGPVPVSNVPGNFRIIIRPKSRPVTVITVDGYKPYVDVNTYGTKGTESRRCQILTIEHKEIRG